MVDPRDLLTFEGLRGLPIVIGLVEVIKRAAPRLQSRYVPLVAIGVGVALNLAIGCATHKDWLWSLVCGVQVGLGAVGLYATTKAISTQKGE